jgi:WD40 repeat protein
MFQVFRISNFVCCLAVLLGLAAMGSSQVQGQIVPKNGQEKASSGTSYALIIGIDKYLKLPKDRQLHFAKADALAMKKLLIKSYGFSPENVTTLTNENATNLAIRHQLARLANSSAIKPEDRILVFFSGHGNTLPTGAYRKEEIGYLIPCDADVALNVSNPEDYINSCLPMSELKSILSLSPSRHIALIADACFSGLIFERGDQGRSIDPKPEKASREVFTAGGRDEETVERPTLGHGIFTHCLLEELTRRSNSEAFTLGSIYDSVRTRVLRLNPKQHPAIGWFDDQAKGEFLFAPKGEYPQEEPPNHLAMVRVTCNVPTAKIEIMGRTLEGNPATSSLDLGQEESKEIRVVGTATNFNSAEETVTIRAGQFNNVDLVLKKRVPPKPNYRSLSSAEELACHSDWVYAVASPLSGEFLFSGGRDGKLRRWNLSNGETEPIGEENLSIRTVACSPDGRTLVAETGDRSVCVYNTDTLERIRVLARTDSSINGLAFSNDARLIAGARQDGKVTIWDSVTGDIRRVINGSYRPLLSVSFSSDGQKICFGGDDGNVYVCSVKEGSTEVLDSHKDIVYGVACSPTSDDIASCGADGTVHVGSRFIFTPEHRDRFHSLAYSPDGGVLAIGGERGRIYLISSRTGDEVRDSLNSGKKRIFSVTFANDGKVLASGGEDHKVRLWRVH